MKSQGKSEPTTKIILVGGGTAGHVEPALAVGQWIASHQPTFSIEFIGTEHGIEKDLVPKAGFPLRCIAKVPLPRTLNFAALSFPFRFVTSLIQAMRIISGSQLVIGFGGYVSASAYVAARILRVPIIIHEANALPGWSNRLGAKFAAHIAVAFPSVPRTFPGWKNARITGMPIRKSIFDLSSKGSQDASQKRGDILKSLGFTPELPVVLVFGGSQGSTAMNSAIQEFARSVEANKIQFIHAVGAKNALPVATSNYRPLSYIYEMADMYLAADLVIARSGAVTCAELDAVHKFAILVPLAIGNGEQEANAHNLLNSGAAVMVKSSEFNSTWLSQNLESAIKSAMEFKSTERREKLVNADEILGELALSTIKVAHS